MKNLFQKCFIFVSLAITFNYIVNLNSLAMNYIGDPMLLKALNGSIRQFFPNRSDTQELLEADIPYVLTLNAKGMDISDISGLEQFIYIKSTIDLSNNNITDITPLINWANNRYDKDVNVNIFLGGNPILLKDDYKQLYILSSMSENIYIYDSQRNGEGIIDLTGFVNGKPVDDVSLGLNGGQVMSDVDGSYEVVDTGARKVYVYILSGLLVVFIIYRCIFGLMKKNKVE